jgi:hypothetical protein
MGIVKITQFLHPNGWRQEERIELPDDICALAKDQVLSMEAAPFDYSKVVLYSRKKSDLEENKICLMADNGPGEHSPVNVLIKLIKEVADRPLVPEIEL